MLQTAPTKLEYEEILKSLQRKENATQIIDYLSQVELEWRRYKWNERSNEMKENKIVIPHILSDNMVEQFFSFIKNERFYPPTKCLSQIFSKLQTRYHQLITEIQKLDNKSETKLNPYAIYCQKREIDRCSSYLFRVNIISLSEMIGIVTQTHELYKFSKAYAVNLKEKTCQCSLYDQYGVLCIHALKLRQALTACKVETDFNNLVQYWCLKDFTIEEMKNLCFSPITEIDIEEYNEPRFRELKLKIVDVQADEVISSKRMRGYQEKSTPSSQLPQGFKKRSKRKFDEVDDEVLNGVDDELEVEWDDKIGEDDDDNNN